MDTEMTIDKAKEIRKSYAALDEAFRAAKKDRRVPFARVAALKEKRDALEPDCDAAIKFLHGHDAPLKTEKGEWRHYSGCASQSGDEAPCNCGMYYAEE